MSRDIGKVQNDINTSNNNSIAIGSGMDCAIIPYSPRLKNLCMVQSIDFFYPLVDDPKIMGRIAMANVLSDIYAVGVTSIDHLKIIISSSEKFSDDERDIVLPLILEGFKECAQIAKCRLELQSLSMNPWCIIGGVATSICHKSKIVMPNNAQPGDVLVLTKPLGTQMACNAFIWMSEKSDKYEVLAQHCTKCDIDCTYSRAVESMTHLNKTAAILMHKYKAHAATDVTGFGLLGHASNLAQFQLQCVKLVITKMPFFRNVLKFGAILDLDKKLRSGTAVETSGGLLIALPRDSANDFCEDYQKICGKPHKAWIIGFVKRREKEDTETALLLKEELRFVEDHED